MRIVTLVLLGLMAAEHLYFLNLQMFRWTHASTVKAFKTTAAVAESSKKLAMNQGLYNGFLAAGLIWAIIAPPPLQRPVAIFFAGCVLIAGVFGGETVSRRIHIIQALPAALALVSIFVFGI
jgi:putative membrane protein